MNLEPGDRINYREGNGTIRTGGVYLRTDEDRFGTRHYLILDDQDGEETYVINFKRITREYTLEHHDLQEIG